MSFTLKKSIYSVKYRSLYSSVNVYIYIYLCNDQDNILLAMFFKASKYIALKLFALKCFSYKYNNVHILKNWG